MKSHAFALAIGFVTLSPLALGMENSILYPRQIQAKPLSPKAQCAREQVRKTFGSVDECLAEYRHRELLALEQKRLEVERERMGRLEERQAAIQDTLERQQTQHDTERTLDQIDQLGKLIAPAAR